MDGDFRRERRAWNWSRASLLRGLLALAALGLIATVLLSNSGVNSSARVRLADGAGGRNQTYLGCGCFWHVQHDLATKVERVLLKRAPQALTAFTGYAGGTRTSEDGHVCYHSMSGFADYGELGHAEVVSLDLPDQLSPAVAAIFFDETCVHGVRRDVQDRGAEYRSVLGFPGGINSFAGQQFLAAATKRGIRVSEGRGDDDDVRGVVWVMDSAAYPFYQAEVFHQFHDDMTEWYGPAYNALRGQLLDAGLIRRTGCPRD
jgi:peptide methionine sulfoxide reductase MsrA